MPIAVLGLYKKNSSDSSLLQGKMTVTQPLNLKFFINTPNLSWQIFYTTWQHKHKHT